MVDISNYNFKPLTDKMVKLEYSFINVYVKECLKSEGTISPTRRMSRILGDKYKSSELNKVMEEHCQHLYTKYQERPLKLLRKLGSFFDGTLSMWKTNMVDLELKEDAKRVCSQPYPVSRVHKMMFKK